MFLSLIDIFYCMPGCSQTPKLVLRGKRTHYPPTLPPQTVFSHQNVRLREQKIPTRGLFHPAVDTLWPSCPSIYAVLTGLSYADGYSRVQRAEIRPRGTTAGSSCTGGGSIADEETPRFYDRPEWRNMSPSLNCRKMDGVSFLSSMVACFLKYI